MDSIISKISEIEAAAAKIVAGAEAKKADLDKEFHDLTMEFDEELEQNTRDKIKEVHYQMNLQKAGTIRAQKEQHELVLEELKKEYDIQHSNYAKEILARITKV